MPVTIREVDGFEVRTPGGVKAKKTTLRKAKAQANLLRAIEHGDWRPTGKPARYKRKKKKRKRTSDGR